MTEQPPPPPPGNPPPPPPPPPGGYPPPPQGAGFPPPPQAGSGFAPRQDAVAGLPQDAYTPWGTRVLAWIIDFIPLAILSGIGVALLLGTQETVCITDTSEFELGDFCATGASTLGQLSVVVTGILSLIYWIWNLGYRQGTTGSSIGKGIMKFKIVSEKTGQPVGFGMSFVREIIYWVAAGLCAGIVWLVAVVFPLFDQKRQTLVDKILNHVALPV
jgi:uncharacterized RDD family membrane protein YckC